MKPSVFITIGGIAILVVGTGVFFSGHDDHGHNHDDHGHSHDHAEATSSSGENLTRNGEFLALLTRGFSDSEDLENITSTWNSTDNIKAIEILNFVGSPLVGNTLIENLKSDTGQDFDFDIQDWYTWLWNNPEQISDDYDDFKADLYKNIDPRFEKYFKDR